MLGATALLTLALAWRMLRARASLSTGCAVLQAFLLAFVVLLASISAGKPDFSPLVLAYGLFFLVPTTFAFARSKARETG